MKERKFLLRVKLQDKLDAKADMKGGNPADQDGSIDADEQNLETANEPHKPPLKKKPSLSKQTSTKL